MNEITAVRGETVMKKPTNKHAKKESRFIK